MRTLAGDAGDDDDDDDDCGGGSGHGYGYDIVVDTGSMKRFGSSSSNKLTELGSWDGAFCACQVPQM